jgi:hypothetical protein
MTQEEKELVVNALCGYLPYGVKINIDSDFLRERGLDVQKLVGVDFSLMIVIAEHNCYNLEKIKPYLRPMSSMTEEELEELCDGCDFEQPYNDYDSYSHYGIEIISEYCVTNEKYSESTINYWVLDYLNSHHFDYRGLIPKGLALEAPQGMY